MKINNFFALLKRRFGKHRDFVAVIVCPKKHGRVYRYCIGHCQRLLVSANANIPYDLEVLKSNLGKLNDRLSAHLLDNMAWKFPFQSLSVENELNGEILDLEELIEVVEKCRVDGKNGKTKLL